MSGSSAAALAAAALAAEAVRGAQIETEVFRETSRNLPSLYNTLRNSVEARPRAAAGPPERTRAGPAARRRCGSA